MLTKLLSPGPARLETEAATYENGAEVEKEEIFRQSIEAGAEAKAKAEEPAVESRPVGLSRSSKKSRPFEAVPEKSSKKLMRLSKKSKKLSSKY